ncbi:hypothetical protein [Spirosoma panaciterrae]|nr:hypothetical protein [Spirosoma panaciterrae]
MMATITLKKIPDDLHRQIKRMQLDREEKGERVSLEDIYIELIRKALEKK